MKYFSLLFIALFISGCNNNDAQDAFEREAYGLVENITETDFQGNILSVDADDWRISPVYTGLATIEPVFPNPLPYGSARQGELILQMKGGLSSSFVELGYLDFNNRWTQIDFQENIIEFSANTFRVSTEVFGSTPELARGIYRLLLFDGNQRIITYGDIMIE